MNRTINRKALVSRHNPIVRGIENLSPLSVGNGEFAFTADFIGLQSFPDKYKVPLGTQSQWAWHSSGGKNLWQLSDVRMQFRDEDNQKGGYPALPEDRKEPYQWLRQNPHRLYLAQIGFIFLSETGEHLQAEAITEIDQQLDLWKGVLYSNYRVEGVPVQVKTFCHPTSDQFGVIVDSPLIRQGRLQVSVRFPAPGMVSPDWDKSIALNWQDNDDSHGTEWRAISDEQAAFIRSMDEDGYRMGIRWSHGEIHQKDTHYFILSPSRESESLHCLFGFSSMDEEVVIMSTEEVLAASIEHWEHFWLEGGAIELAESQDTRAFELERRIVLSQYLTAIHCAGSLPPQETGLLYNSWFGKFHLEMHWWHSFHFPLWGRTELLRRSMDWYGFILPMAKDLAAYQGYKGARWPNMVGREGRQSPSNVAPLLIWQQPHPIVLAELCYLAEPTIETLQHFDEIVFESAEFMASFVEWDAERSKYVLGPPVIPAQELHRAEETWNPTYELEYWHHGLETAMKWAERLEREIPAHWRDVYDKLSSHPIADGLYQAHENCSDSFMAPNNRDHPSMLGALGMLPGKMIDTETMRKTLLRVIESWNWEGTWGWDYPMSAMTAARLGEGSLAVEILLKDVTKNTYLPNGHNYQSPRLMAYLPGNGGLLIAVAMMAAGWQNGPKKHAPGFPDDGSWTVRYEGLNAWM